MLYINFFLILKTTERNAVSADSIRQKLETKEYLPEWLEIKKPLEDKSIDPTQDRTTSIEELYSRHGGSSSDKTVQRVRNIYVVKMVPSHV